MSSHLTFEQTKGTKTYHLPFEKAGRHARMTFMVERLPDGNFAAGVSVCSLNDQFENAVGRIKAFFRMKKNPITAKSGTALYHKVCEHLDKMRAETNPLSEQCIDDDLYNVCEDLTSIFNNLEEKHSGKASASCVASCAGDYL